MAEVATKNYELYFILDAKLSKEQTQKEVTKLSNFLESKIKASNLQVEEQGVKKFAYPIKKSRSGYYVLVNFDLAVEKGPELVKLEKDLNLSERVIRYILVDQTDFNKAKAKEKEGKESEITDHQELNKGKKTKKCITDHIGLEAIDYKDAEYLEQFTSPYAKIFAKSRTGSSSKNQRKIKQAIKRARHMGLMPFTPLHMD